MSSVGYATLQIIPSLRGADAAITSQLSKVDGKAAGGKFGASFGAGLKGAVGPAIAAVGIGAAIKVGSGLLDAAEESRTVTRQTDAVLKSMGSAAGVTSGHVGNLADRLSGLSGVDDELVQSGENVLLTFGKVANQVGDGNDIFDRGSEAALNMSVALKQDLKSANVQIGKALNDPVKGITALSRAGVSFTQQQKDQIKAMAESGDTLGAQKIILGELEKQFGGSAEAQATASDKLRVAFGNIQEDLGAKLLPVIEKAQLWIAENLPKAFAVVETAVRRYWPAIQEGITSAVETIQSIVGPIIGALQSLWANFGDNILAYVQAVWPAIQQTISGALEIIRGVIQVVTSLIKGDWSGVWEGIKSILHGALDVIIGRIKQVWETLEFIVGVGFEVLSGLFSAGWDGLVGFVKDMPERIAKAASGLFDGLVEAFKTAINAIIDIWNDFEIKFDGYDIPGPGPNIPSFSIKTPNLPHLAAGGIASRATLGVFGEGTYDEAVLPLSASTFASIAAPLAAELGTMGATGGPQLHVYPLPGENLIDAGMRALRWHQTIKATVNSR